MSIMCKNVLQRIHPALYDFSNLIYYSSLMPCVSYCASLTFIYNLQSLANLNYTCAISHVKFFYYSFLLVSEDD